MLSQSFILKQINTALDKFIEQFPKAECFRDCVNFSIVRRSDFCIEYRNACAIYCPERIVKDENIKLLQKSASGETIFGNPRSIVILVQETLDTANWINHVVWHECAHIFSILNELPDGTFLNMGTDGRVAIKQPIDMPDAQWKDEFRHMGNGYLCWKETIAERMARMIESRLYGQLSFNDPQLHKVTSEWISELYLGNEIDYGCLSQWLAMMLSVNDINNVLDKFSHFNIGLGESNKREPVQSSLKSLLVMLNDQFNTEHFWEIDPFFIARIGETIEKMWVELFIFYNPLLATMGQNSNIL